MDVAQLKKELAALGAKSTGTKKVLKQKEARLYYIKSNKYTVIETGLIIPKKQPWLGYSPDGIVFIENVPTKLLEIKCPVIGQQKNSTALVVHCDYLQIENYCSTLCASSYKLLALE